MTFPSFEWVFLGEVTLSPEELLLGGCLCVAAGFSAALLLVALADYLNRID